MAEQTSYDEIGHVSLEDIVQALYQGMLNRPAPPDDAKLWVDRCKTGLSLDKLIETFLRSPEFLVKSRVDSDAGILEDVVGAAYSVLLQRQVGETEIENWREAVSKGSSFGSIIRDVADSEEARSLSSAFPVNDFPIEATLGPELVDGAIRVLYRGYLNRYPQPVEFDMWRDTMVAPLGLVRVLTQIATSEEAASVKTDSLLPSLSDGEFAIFCYTQIRARCPDPSEIDAWDKWFREGVSRNDLVCALINEAFNADQLRAKPAVPQTSSSVILGTRKHVTEAEWARRKAVTNSGPATPWLSRYKLKLKSSLLVTAIASLYKGGEYISKFMENITSQSIFDRCELIIIDAASPDNEYLVIEPYLKKYRNIKYKRLNYVAGIYEAWNIAIAMSEAPYITNVNLDDVRRFDSFEMQAATLESLPFVDIVYQDVLYTFEANSSFESLAKAGVKSALPIVDVCNLLIFNSPHNAPMWRRSLHEEVGVFTERFRSAGDYEFWLRCLDAGKTFFKINDPHVGYFVNPRGLSTSEGGWGEREAREISMTVGRQITPQELVEPLQDFCRRLKISVEEVSGVSARFDIAHSALCGLGPFSAVVRPTKQVG